MTVLAANFGADFRVARCILGTETWLKITGTTVDALRHYNLAMNYKGERDGGTSCTVVGRRGKSGEAGEHPCLGAGGCLVGVRGSLQLCRGWGLC